MKVEVMFAGSIELSVKDDNVLKSIIAEKYNDLKVEIDKKIIERLKNTDINFEEITLVELKHEDPILDGHTIFET